MAGTRWHLSVIDTTTGRQVGSRIAGGFMGWFSPDGKTLAVACRDNRIALREWPPPSRWPLAVGVGVLGIAIPFGALALVRRSRRRCMPAADSIKTLYPQS
jgi:hypothetical protein